MQRPVFNTILEVRVIDMVDHCGQGLFHHIAWQNCLIQIITIGVPRYFGVWEYPLDIPGTSSPDQQFSRATILAYDGQVAVVCHYPHLILSLCRKQLSGLETVFDMPQPLSRVRPRAIVAATPRNVSTILRQSHFVFRLERLAGGLA